MENWDRWVWLSAMKRERRKDESTMGLGWCAGKIDGDKMLSFLFVSIICWWWFLVE